MCTNDIDDPLILNVTLASSHSLATVPVTLGSDTAEGTIDTGAIISCMSEDQMLAAPQCVSS